MSCRRNRGLPALGVLAAAMLAGCATTQPDVGAQGAAGALAVARYDGDARHLRTPLVRDGLDALRKGDYRTASASFNHVLKQEPQNPYLHFLNGFAYHAMADKGERDKLELAATGYRLALQFDPAAWWAEYFNGLLDLDRRDFAGAQRHFASAGSLDRGNVEALKGLATAAYYNGDLKAASKAVASLMEQAPSDPWVARTAALVHAAAGEGEVARHYLWLYNQAEVPEFQRDYLAKRVADWGVYHAATTPITQSDMLIRVADGAAATSTPPAPAKEGSMRQAIVDVAIIRSLDEQKTKLGVNLLQGLQMTFGYSDQRARTSLNGVAKAAATSAGIGFDTYSYPRVLTQALTIPAVTYSLNIFNDENDHHELLARPTLIALDGKTSRFFSGSELTIGLTGTWQGGTLEDKELGVSLQVTPTFLSDDKLILHVEAKRNAQDDFIPTTFHEAIQASKNYVEADVVMEFGQTLVLSGLSERESQKVSNRTPVLGDIPVLKTLFHDRHTVEYTRSVLMLITPQRPVFVNEGGAEGAIRPGTNLDAIRRGLKDARYYQEFRRGDVGYDGMARVGNVERALNTVVALMATDR